MDQPGNTLRNLDEFVNVLPRCDFSDNSSFEKDFFKVVVARGLGRTVVNDFLTLFRKHKIGHFPKDARSFLGSMRIVPTEEISPGKYHHFGLCQSLNDVLKYTDLPENIDRVKIQVNIDGLPLSRSSNRSFWPILGSVVFPIRSKVFMIGLYFGEKKTCFSSAIPRSFH